MLLDAASILIAMADNNYRYEFRVWAANLAELCEKLGGFATPTRSTSKETYLISTASDLCNAKIRSGLMDIKILIAEDRGLEQWKPVLKAGFPLEQPVIATQVFPSLGVKASPLPRTQYSMDEFFNEVVAAQRAITVAQVSKTRLQYNLDPCQAEFASVLVNAVPLDTVAIESTDPNAVLKLIRDLSLDAGSNTSYVRQIKRVLGLTAK
jgi:exopolyphosphatase / guanosine-5'-triphosphate,3'-diphosphate pyrophosphatase